MNQIRLTLGAIILAILTFSAETFGAKTPWSNSAGSQDSQSSWSNSRRSSEIDDSADYEESEPSMRRSPERRSSSASRGRSTRSEKRREAPSAPFAPDSHNAAFCVGQVFLLGDNSERGNALGISGNYTYSVSDLFGFNGGIGYSSHDTGKYNLTYATSGVRMNLMWFDQAIPYVAGGLGFYRPSFDVSVPAGQPDSFINGQNANAIAFGLHFSTGVDLALSKSLFFGVGLTFHDMFGTTANVKGIPIKVDGTFTTFLLRAGGTF